MENVNVTVTFTGTNLQTITAAIRRQLTGETTTTTATAEQTEFDMDATDEVTTSYTKKEVVAAIKAYATANGATAAKKVLKTHGIKHLDEIASHEDVWDALMEEIA